MSRKREIQPVKNNTDKQLTYREIKTKYKIAIDSGFLLEALLIVYAMIEDRLLAFLYHSGIQEDRAKLDVPGGIENQLRDIIRENKRSKETDTVRLGSISGKIKIIRCLVQWTSESEVVTTDAYLKSLKFQYESLDAADFLNKLEELKRWIPYRNEVVHSLLNKNMDALHLELEEKVKEGRRLADYFDYQVKVVKKGGYIRAEAGL